MANKANIPFQRDEVDVIHRLPRMDKDKRKPRNVVIQFKNRTARNKWLEKRKHGVKVGNINNSGDMTPIYINEHLTPEMKNLLWRTKDTARQKMYEFVWVKDGKIFAKKDANSRRFFTETRVSDLAKL